MTVTDSYTEELAIDLAGSALLAARNGVNVHRIDGEDGSLLIEFTATSSGCLFELIGKNGRLSVDVNADRLLGRIDLDGESRSLDAEDALGMADGTIHSVGLTADETGTHLFADGYETFSATLRAWCQDLGATHIIINPSGILEVRRFRMWNSALSLPAMMAKAPAAMPLIEFASSELSARDARRTGELAHGALRARTRLRGEGQGEPSSRLGAVPVSFPSRSSAVICSCTWKPTMNPSRTCALRASGTTGTGMTWLQSVAVVPLISTLTVSSWPTNPVRRSLPILAR